MHNDIYLEQGEIVEKDESRLYIKSHMRVNTIYRAGLEENYKTGDKVLFAVLLDGSIEILKKIGS